MNVAYLNESNSRFLHQSIRFCKAIGPYMTVLGLNRLELELFKNELAALLYISENYKSFSASFIICNIGTMRKGFKDLVNDCLYSINYTESIGGILGISEKVKVDAATFKELEFYKSFEN